MGINLQLQEMGINLQLGLGIWAAEIFPGNWRRRREGKGIVFIFFLFLFFFLGEFSRGRHIRPRFTWVSTL